MKNFIQNLKKALINFPGMAAMTLLGILCLVAFIGAFLGLPTFIIFLIIKLCKVITWNWVLVFLPFIVFVISVFPVSLIIYSIMEE